MNAYEYLSEKAAGPEREWLRREPRETHPEILELVRAAQAGGLFYDDDVERYCNERIEGMPEHERHGAGRHVLVEQLAHEVYIGKCQLRDEEATAEIMRALDDGYEPFNAAALEEGRRYLVRFGTVYSGQVVAQYGKPVEVSYRHGALMPKGARTRGYGMPLTSPALVRAAV